MAIWAGTNDVLQHNEKSALDYYYKLIKYLKQKKCKVYVLGLCLRGRSGKYFSMELQRMCRDLRTNFIDFEEIWNPNWLSKDGVHLSRIGNRMVSREVSKAMNI